MERRQIEGVSLSLFIVILACLGPCASAWGQATAQITGTVRDPSGAVLPGVEVKATQTETGISRSTITNETGAYVLPNLALGPYRLEAALAGFRTFVQTNLLLQVNSNPSINVVLEIGQVAESVEVQANAAQVETRSTAVGQVIENERILELPLNGRQVTDLITLSGAAVQTGVSNTKTTWQGGVFVSVAGGQNFGVMYSLDGALHNNAYDGTQMPMPFPDALQEFKVEASGMSAAGGTRGSGGQVNAVTKSGTNDFHGGLFEFVRNYAFNARNFFNAKRDSLKRNQYGGTLGGPILKNKLFFFGGYQGTRTRSDGSPITAFVPTSATLAGDFTTFASPACNGGRQIALRAPFVNSRMDPALYSSAALKITATLPQTQDACGRIVYGVVARQNEMQAVSKMDYQQNTKHSIFGRYLATTFLFPHPYNSVQHNNVLTTSDDAAGFDNLAQSFTVGSTYLISPTTINSFRVAMNRTALHRAGASFYSAPSMGVNAYSPRPDHVNLSVTGGFTLGNRTGGVFTTTSYQIGDDLSVIRGNHQITLGANVAQWRTVQRDNSGDFGTYAFTGNALGLGMADFLTGNLTTLTQQQPVVWSTRQSYIAGYVADVWKWRPKLTFNYGLRWEPFLPLTLKEGAMYNFNQARFDQGIKSKIYPNAPAGLYYPGDQGFPDGAPVHKKWGLVAPRVGLAWDPRGDGRTSLRASYGLAYDFSGSITLGGSSSAPPWGFVTTVQSPTGGFADPWRDFPGGDPFPYNRALLPRFAPSASYYTIPNYDVSPPTVQTWNLSIQRQVSGDFLASASYLGSQKTHLWVQANINRAVYFPGNAVNGICTVQGFVLQTSGTCSTTTNTNQRRRLALLNPQQGQFFGELSTREDSGTAQYHGLLLSLQRRAARGVTIAGNYTWSHCIGNEATANTTGASGPGYLDPNNRNFDRGNCAADRRQIFNLTSVAATPQFANPMLRKLGTGWQLSGIYRWSTGDYLTVLTGLDRVLNGNATNQRPNQILGSPYGDRNSITNYLNPSAFAQPEMGSLGNMRPYNINGPGNWQLDMGLSRVFSPRENQKLEFRVEAFNVTNSLKRGDPNLTLNSNTFGQITTYATSTGTALGPRIMQFALKYMF